MICRCGALSVPPLSLRLRATANGDPATFQSAGSQLAGVFAAVVSAEFTQPRLLDWGCGPGRVTAPLTELQPSWTICGCDVDHEAVAWCQEHLAGDFRPTGLLPPLPWPDGDFDAVMACSVFTHLTAGRQDVWLAEIVRLLRPGGILVASVHGEPARAKYIPRLPAILEDNGIFDQLVSTNMNGVIPEGEYRVTFQSENWTRAHGGTHLDVTGYQAAGLTPEHDLVICHKRAGN